MTETTPARVRFAPSPTGYLHIGSARTALCNYLLARQTGGQFILRVEDTDRERYVADSEQDIKDGLRWLGLEWDEGPEVGGPAAPYTQSQRADIHRAHAENLVESGQAYYCFCSKARLDAVRGELNKYDSHCRKLSPEEARRRKEAGEPYVVRFKMPQSGTTTVHDLLRGEITVENAHLDDFILLKSDGMAVYHLAAMVDDHEMGITHVIRGEEWLPSLPRHALIIRAFDWEEPIWCHLAVFKKPSGKGKLSKRDAADLKATEGHSIFIRELRELGYLPDAVNNWMVLMGWSYDDKTEDFTMEELIEKFSLERINPSPTAVDFAKLDYFQGKYLRQLSPQAIAAGIKPYLEAEGLTPDDATLLRVAPLIQERIVTFEDALDWAGFFFRDEVQPLPEELVAKKLTPAETLAALKRARGLLADLQDFHHHTTHPALRALAEELDLKAGQLFTPVRVAVTGQRVSPPLFETMEIIGREVVLARLTQAERLLASISEA